MVLQSASLKDLQNFCDEQFKAAEGENAKLLSADEVKRLSEVRNRAESASKEYDELARNYQQLLKDYKENILHTTGVTAEKTKEVEEPAGDAKPANSTFDAEKFTEQWFKEHAPDQI